MNKNSLMFFWQNFENDKTFLIRPDTQIYPYQQIGLDDFCRFMGRNRGLNKKHTKCSPRKIF